MRIHHFYPRTNNIGDHFVQRGIETMVRRIRPEATIELFDINSRGRNQLDYGLTRRAVERANSEADVIIVGGSNLYEGNYRWPWGVYLEADALDQLHVPLVLLGIGSGSGFCAPLHVATKRAKDQIRLLNDRATLSGARDVITLNWLHKIGVGKAKLSGDPATFVFDKPFQRKSSGHILVTMPPRRFWSSLHQFRNVRKYGRAMFKALVSLVQRLVESGEDVVVACNDPLDLPLTQALFVEGPDVVCPQTSEDYFHLLSASRAVLSGRLHTAIVAFSLGLPFVLMNVDQRTEGFIKTYGLECWSLTPSIDRFELVLRERLSRLLQDNDSAAWDRFINLRNEMNAHAMKLLKTALE